MFRLRRFRAFLIVAVVVFVCAYEFYLNDWGVPSIETLGFSTPRNKNENQRYEPPSPGPPAEHPQSPPEPDAPNNDKHAEHVPEAPKSKANPTYARTATPAAQTVTGEELLQEQSSDNFELSRQAQGRLSVPARPAGKPSAVWVEQPEHFPVQKVTELPVGDGQQIPRIQYDFQEESAERKKGTTARRKAVKEAFKHAWKGYSAYAMGHDELRPLTNGSADGFNGWGATLVDTLDTLWIMGLHDEFEWAVGNVTQINFKTSPRKDIPMFETTIRYLGGLLAAYDLSNGKYTILLDKAVELAEVMMGAFDTPNRMPDPYYKWAPSYASQPHRSDTHTVLAELGSLAMEFTRLAQITKEHKYYDAIARITDELEKWQDKTSWQGLWPIRVDSSGCKKSSLRPKDASKSDGESAKGNSGTLGKRQVDDASDNEAAPLVPNPNDEAFEASDFVSAELLDDDVFAADCESQGLAHEPREETHMYSIGAMADSTYEYFPKMHALLEGRNRQYRSMYLKAADAIRKDFVFRPMLQDSKRDVRFLAKHELTADKSGRITKDWKIYEGSHLACYAGGMFALGSKIFDIPADMDLATKLTDGCVWSYESMPAGVMPELFALTPCEDEKHCSPDESKWHTSLDPNLQERFDAVARFNAHQKALAESANVDADALAEEEEAERKFNPSDKRKRAEAPAWKAPDRSTIARENEEHDEPAPTSATVGLSADGSFASSDDNTSPAPVVPRVALSHQKFVAARIAEERLTLPYTELQDRAYKLRPEALESVFIMYRITGDSTWREKGWKMFQSIVSATETASGHAQLKDVTSALGEQADKMESFWLAETLKYAYLLFSEESLVSLDEWVLNTEAHPFRRERGKTMARGM
ncbi:Endoplasmic reticulum mannosyl-oligosaccharide 1,2-alpha-mannosidase [Cyphellophora attinorum]|uniref:alpha-1,2-Mannosidase n=1 Tax=Cyphellophora attinorum TaxID=1664694 RepID=A0A0N1P2X2_9EURO|nr:Endoplasmic reticulum mannosyl-oligosaccharide 1,2-alpha-mannosidase [Phialophora attinorum]KPI43123.1 Endoplasmic reticulum mannosyl-oligosaccharide 1,2-alpha-mannosidase [Phialophora attinorum]